MAGIFNIDLSGIGQTASSIGDLATKLRSAIPGQIPPEKQAEIIGDLNDLYAAAQTAQTEIDKVEANSSKLFVAGWRPFIGWVCGAILAYNYLFRPLIVLVPGLPTLPYLNYGEISPVLLGLLGLGTMRTVEKINNAAGNH
jgi:hypothetical protein